MARRIFRKSLKDGQFPVGPPFSVPDHIRRPHLKNPTSFAQKINHDEAVLARKVARIAASALSLARSLVKPGTTTADIDLQVSRYIVSREAYPSGIGFLGFPKAMCQSVNEIIAHGIPDSRPLQDGDIVNFDITAYKEGFYGDNSDMGLVGNIDDQGIKLVDSTREALAAAIAACKPGQPFSVISEEISKIADRDGFSVVDYFCGHFIGREMHIAPNIHHNKNVPMMDTLRMEPGMLFTIEPIFVEGSTEADVWQDGWTYVTKDNGRTAQAEHMVLITDSGHEILTIPDDKFS